MAVLDTGNTDVREREVLAEREVPAMRRESWSPERERRVSMEVVSTGSMIKAAGGFAATVLAILCLSNVVPGYLGPVAVIVIGTALLMEGIGVAARFWRLPGQVDAGPSATAEVAGGMIAQVLAGIAGIVLGILALAGYAPALLTAVAVLTFGAALILSSGLTARLNHIEQAESEGSTTGLGSGTNLMMNTGRFFRAVTNIAVGLEIIAGLAVIILSVLVIRGLASVSLAEVSLLILGLTILLSGTAVTTRIMQVLHRC